MYKFIIIIIKFNIDCLYRKTLQLLYFYHHFLCYGVMTINTKRIFTRYFQFTWNKLFLECVYDWIGKRCFLIIQLCLVLVYTPSDFSVTMQMTRALRNVQVTFSEDCFPPDTEKRWCFGNVLHVLLVPSWIPIPMPCLSGLIFRDSTNPRNWEVDNFTLRSRLA